MTHSRSKRAASPTRSAAVELVKWAALFDELEKIGMAAVGKSAVGLAQKLFTTTPKHWHVNPFDKLFKAKQVAPTLTKAASVRIVLHNWRREL